MIRLSTVTTAWMHLVKLQAKAAELKYDANNIYLATTYSETQNMTVLV